MAFVRLSCVLLFVPVMSLVAIPLVVSMGFAALWYRVASALFWAAARRVLPRRLMRGAWWGAYDDEEDEDDDEVWQGGRRRRGGGEGQHDTR